MTLLRGHGKPIAYAVNRLNVCGILRPILDFFPYAPDVHIDAALGHGSIVSPHAIQELVAGEHHARVRSKMVQQSEFEGAQLHRAPATKTL